MEEFGYCNAGELAPINMHINRGQFSRVTLMCR